MSEYTADELEKDSEDEKQFKKTEKAAKHKVARGGELCRLFNPML